jgi:hypothetical protein
MARLNFGTRSLCAFPIGAQNRVRLVARWLAVSPPPRVDEKRRSGQCFPPSQRSPRSERLSRPLFDVPLFPSTCRHDYSRSSRHFALADTHSLVPSRSATASSSTVASHSLHPFAVHVSRLKWLAVVVSRRPKSSLHARCAVFRRLQNLLWR